jgi:hypothetical protein
MKSTIWKEKIALGNEKITDILLPRNSTVLDIQADPSSDENVLMWFAVNNSLINLFEHRKFKCIYTGFSFSWYKETMKYLKTVQVEKDYTVHIFEVKE